ncbi:GntR family transcriptional regulator [Castellaniella sp.]|uniref:GntR family transcriptional regulator n=1 Tax=Castellaniella sp. TaxID=1955812 RepID=UPI003C731250
MAPKPYIARNTLCEQIYLHLREQILTGRIKQGEHLTELAISRDTNVSATPVREALRLLHGDGLVELNGRRGAKVIQPSEEDVRHAFAVRRELERLALREAFSVLTRQDLDELKALSDRMMGLTQGDTQAFFQADWDFHHFFVSRANNSWLESFLASLKDFLQIVRNPNYKDTSPHKTAREHLAVVEAILAGDIGEAERLLGAHIDRVCTDILEQTRQTLRGEADPASTRNAASRSA